MVPVSFGFSDAAFVFNKVDDFLQAEAALIDWFLERPVRVVLGNNGAGGVAELRVPRAGAAGNATFVESKVDDIL